MKKIVGISLALSLSFTAQAAEKFAGIELHSSLPHLQVRVLKEDLTYLHNSLIKEVDPDLKPMAELSQVDGPHLYNWVYNRVKFIVGEKFLFRGKNIVNKKGHVFPNTPIPPSLLGRTNSYAGTLIMSNMGSELYLLGKLEKVLKGVKLDNRQTVYAPSPRVGILQVGEGLFLERLLINKDQSSEANKIKRLGTIFHEARHTDGNSEHIGFIHSKCPSGHALSGFAACEGYSNGAYAIEAVAAKTLLLNCKTCSNEDKTKLSVSIADAYSRIVVRSHVRTEKEILEEIKTYQGVIDFYEKFIALNPSGVEASIKELERLRAKVKECEEQLKELKADIKPVRRDPKPEGPFQDVSVEESTRLMKSSPSR